MKSKRRSPGVARPATPAPRLPWGRLALGAGALGLLVAGLLAVRGQGIVHRARAPGDDAPPSQAVADSAREALKRSDWFRAQALLGRLLRHDPRDPTLLLGAALAIHNAAWLPDPRQRRSPCRTSLDRIRAEHTALALMDSAATCSGSPGEWVRARDRQAQTYQNLGLFTDALDVYRSVEQRYPSYADARTRSQAVVDRLRSGLE